METGLSQQDMGVYNQIYFTLQNICSYLEARLNQYFIILCHFLIVKLLVLKPATFCSVNEVVGAHVANC